MNIIECKNISKKYKNFTAVDDISFTVKEGEFFCLIGANGAGKSTLLDIITKRIVATSGTVEVLGASLEKLAVSYFKNIGIVFQSHVLDAELSVKQNLNIRANMYLAGEVADKRVKELLLMTGMKEHESKKYKMLSGGEKRKVDIIASILHKPSILFLDEPTTGVDVQSRREIWEFIHTMRVKENMTIFLTTHYLEEAERADYMILMDQGKIVAQGTPTQLRQTIAKDTLLLVTQNNEALEQKLSELQLAYTIENQNYLLTLEHTKDSLKIISLLDTYIDTFEVKIGKLEDVFMYYIDGGTN